MELEVDVHGRVTIEACVPLVMNRRYVTALQRFIICNEAHKMLFVWFIRIHTAYTLHGVFRIIVRIDTGQRLRN
jgi:hypothetical protein